MRRRMMPCGRIERTDKATADRTTTAGKQDGDEHQRRGVDASRRRFRLQPPVSEPDPVPIAEDDDIGADFPEGDGARLGQA